MEAELILHNHTDLGEGPVWDHRTNTLFWVDILKGHVQAFDYSSGDNEIYQMGEYTGAVVPSVDGRLVVALQNRVIWLDPKSASVETLCEPEPGKTTNRFNDGKCDPAGRFWIGSTEIDHKNPTGTLYCILPDTTFTAKLTNLHISNGIAWSLDGSIMYFIDSLSYKVRAFSYAAETGLINYQKDVICFKPETETPDGMCIDMKGNLWIALYGAGKVVCVEPDSGEVIRSVQVGAKNTTSCCFGGLEMNELFITTAKRDDEKGGGLYRCLPGVAGPTVDFFGQ